jgi:hypothetical protein
MTPELTCIDHVVQTNLVYDKYRIDRIFNVEVNGRWGNFQCATNFLTVNYKCVHAARKLSEKDCILIETNFYLDLSSYKKII